jgi:copper chaperone CopZ
MDSSEADASSIDFVDAEFTIEGLTDPTKQKALNDALSGLAGVKTFELSHDKVAAEYDPTRITKAQLTEAITRVGFRVAEIESAAASPLADVLHDPKTHPPSE